MRITSLSGQVTHTDLGVYVNSLPPTTSNSLSKTRIETREFKVSYDNFESAVLAWLYSVGAIPKHLDVVGSDFGVEVDKDGLVHFDLELVPFGTAVQGELDV